MKKQLKKRENMRETHEICVFLKETPKGSLPVVFVVDGSCLNM